MGHKKVFWIRVDRGPEGIWMHKVDSQGLVRSDGQIRPVHQVIKDQPVSQESEEPKIELTPNEEKVIEQSTDENLTNHVFNDSFSLFGESEGDIYLSDSFLSFSMDE